MRGRTSSRGRPNAGSSTSRATCSVVARSSRLKASTGSGQRAAAHREVALEARVQQHQGGQAVRVELRRDQHVLGAAVGSPVSATWKYGMGKPSRACRRAAPRTRQGAAPRPVAPAVQRAFTNTSPRPRPPRAHGDAAAVAQRLASRGRRVLDRPAARR